MTPDLVLLDRPEDRLPFDVIGALAPTRFADYRPLEFRPLEEVEKPSISSQITRWIHLADQLLAEARSEPSENPLPAQPSRYALP